MIFNVSGGGGAALNFRVLAYATEADLLAATPNENAIGIITTTPITSWLFSAVEPSPAEAGMVWINVGTFSPVEFNALKKNGLQVYPISAKQYVGGAWVDKTAKSYQGGEWVDWMIYLFDETKGQMVPFTSTKETNGSVSIGTNSIVLSYSSGNNGQSIARTSETVDLTASKRLVFDAICTGHGSDSDYAIGAGIVSTVAPAIIDRNASYPAYIFMTADSTRKLYAIDISGLSGKYYVGVKGCVKATIYNIWLE